MELSCNDNSMESNTVKKNLIINDFLVQGLSRPLVHRSDESVSHINVGVEIYTLHLVPPLTEVTLTIVVHLTDPVLVQGRSRPLTHMTDEVVKHNVPLGHINSKPTAVVGHVTPCSPEPLVRLGAYRGQLSAL